MSQSTKKELAAVAEVLHAYFQDLFQVQSGKVKVGGQIHKKGKWKDRAIDIHVTIEPGDRYNQLELMGNWVSADTKDQTQADKERKQLHPDTVYAALYLLQLKSKIRSGGLGYYQLRTKVNSQKWGQPLASASHNPTYILPSTHKESWLWTRYEGETAPSKWSKYISSNSQKTHIDGLENVEYANINSNWYGEAYKKNVQNVVQWVNAGVLPSHVTDKIKQMASFPVDWGTSSWYIPKSDGWIPTVVQAMGAQK
jgi:hypothetical protein